MMRQRRRMLMAVANNKRLPLAYQEVEYIENNGNAFIDTGVITNQDTGVDMEISLTTGSTFFGARTAWDRNAFAVGTGADFKVAATYGTQPYIVTEALTADVRYRVFLSKNKLYINNIPMYTFLDEAFTPNISMYLGAYHNGTGVAYSGVKKIYSAKVYSADVLERDYVPCYRKSDNIAGMYDLVTGVFYVNAGTGVFVKGADV